MTNQIIKQAQEIVNNSRFGKEGGSSFECSDYEGMYTDLVERVSQAITQAVEEREEEIKEIVKHAQPTFFSVGDGLSDKEQQLIDDAVYETRVEIYEQLFENKKNLTLKDVLKKPRQTNQMTKNNKKNELIEAVKESFALGVLVRNIECEVPFCTSKRTIETGAGNVCEKHALMLVNKEYDKKR